MRPVLLLLLLLWDAFIFAKAAEAAYAAIKRPRGRRPRVNWPRIAAAAAMLVVALLVLRFILTSAFR
jgi:hypothetical protein